MYFEIQGMQRHFLERIIFSEKETFKGICQLFSELAIIRQIKLHQTEGIN